MATGFRRTSPIETTVEGGLKIEASPAAARTLGAVFQGLAELLQKAASD